jgi:DNA mismatch repair protein MutS
MAFIADKQTIEDLNLLGKFKPQSIFSLFNKVKTTLGERLLEEMFNQPLTDPVAINTRSGIFQFFQQQQQAASASQQQLLELPFSAVVFRTAEQYLSLGTQATLPAVWSSLLRKRLAASLVRDEQWAFVQTGLAAAVNFLSTLHSFVNKLHAPQGSAYFNELSSFRSLLSDPRLQSVYQSVDLSIAADKPSFTFWQFASLDHLLRHTLRDTIEQIITHVARLDVYIAVSAVAAERDFHYAHALPKSASQVNITALRHPALHKGVANPLHLSSTSNLLFLTGANMAGKSTFMKAFGIAVYLAHMGFPIAATDMEFSVRDGLFSSINVPDNLSLGYSHFYAEVLRVKTVAQAVNAGKDLVVIFDELFKGTNVKDAYDATVAVSAAFTAYRNCCFIISTHIIEAGEALGQQIKDIQFAYLPTIMEGPIPRYTYQLTPGITNDRHGMMIILNEGILEMI